MSETTDVSIVNCTNYEKENVLHAIDQTFRFFGGIENIIKKDVKVLLKPNLLKESAPNDCIITHPIVIEVIAEKILEAGAKPVIGDSPAFGAVTDIAKRAGLYSFIKKHDIEIIELDKPQKILTKCGLQPFSLTVSSKALNADVIINIPKLKAHTQLLYTAAVKNMYGCVCGKRKAWRHFRSKNYLTWYTEMLLANYQAVKPAFTIVDAVMTMEKHGPSGGLPKKMSLFISGNDCIAIDRVIAELIQVSPSKVPLLKTAKLHNIGEQNLKNIDILGQSISSAKVPDFRLPQLTPIGFSAKQVIKSLAKHLWLKSFGRAASFLLMCCLLFSQQVFSGETINRLQNFPEHTETGDIIHIPTGIKVQFSDLIPFFYGTRLIYVGETHANNASHQVQLKVLKLCYEKYGDDIAIGMEMFTRPYQPFLDQWIAGEIDEEKFLELTDWYEEWGYDYLLYKDLMDFAREKKIPIIALNAPKHVVKMVSQKGLQDLTDEEKKELPVIDTTGYFHKVYLKNAISGHIKDEENIEKYNNVQCLWEEYMAQSIAEYLSSWDGMGKKMLVFAGNGHIIYDFGIPKRVFRRMHLPYYTIYTTTFKEGNPSDDHNIFMANIPLEPSDFVWIIPPVADQKKRVFLGVQLEKREDKKLVIDKVSEGGPAEKSGLIAGDTILSIDGKELKSIMDLIHYLQTKEFGETCTIVIDRDGTKISFAVTLFEMK